MTNRNTLPIAGNGGEEPVAANVVAPNASLFEPAEMSAGVAGVAGAASGCVFFMASASIAGSVNEITRTTIAGVHPGLE
jgi:hypothetical protein